MNVDCAVTTDMWRREMHQRRLIEAFNYLKNVYGDSFEDRELMKIVLDKYLEINGYTVNELLKIMEKTKCMKSGSTKS